MLSLATFAAFGDELSKIAALNPALMPAMPTAASALSGRAQNLLAGARKAAPAVAAAPKKTFDYQAYLKAKQQIGPYQGLGKNRAGVIGVG